MRKVLIVDTSEHWRELMERELGSRYQVRSCGDGVQALTMADRFRPDVVIMDLMLPGVDGLSVIKKLREQSEKMKIIVTGRYFSNFVNMALERYQVDSAMLKPCTVQIVGERVAELLEMDTSDAPVCQDPFDCITVLLVRLGAPTSQQGFRFLRRGILLLMEDPNQQLTKNLYPAIAAEFETSAANVEKALRTTVTTAWSRRRDEIWRHYFPLAPSGQIPRPTAGQFLNRLADVVQSVLRKQA